MVKVLNREQGNRMWGGKSNVYGVSGGGTGGGDVDLSSYATMAWTKQNFVSIEYFRTLFKAFDSNDDEIVPNNTTSVVNNIKAMVGLWTGQYLTALGNQSGGGGGGGGASYLNDLLDVQLTTPLTDGQALVYNATLQKWVNGAAGVNMTTVWNALAGSTNEQINASHLSTALSGYVTTSDISDMATQTWVGQQGFATQTWVTSNFITIAYFDRLFRAYNGNTLVSHNDTTTTIDNIKAMFGFWTEFYLSALGTGGVSSVSISLSQLADVNVTGVTNGQVLSYNSTSGTWVPTTISNVTSLSALTDVALSSPTTYQVLMYDASTTKWYNSALKTINGQPLYGSGDISVGGGASGNYLPLTGGTLVGHTWLSYGTDSWLGIISPNNAEIIYFGNQDSGYIYGSTAGYYVSCKDNKVGILKQIPDYTLDVNGVISSNSIIRVENYDGYFSVHSSGANEYYAFGASNNGYIWGSVNGRYLTFENGYTTANKRFEIRNESGGSPYLLFHIPNVDWGNIRLKDNGEFYFYEGDGDSSPAVVNASWFFAYSQVTALSDARKKDVIDNIFMTVEQVANAPAVRFTWKGERVREGIQVGTLAQYWQGALPEVVKEKDGELSMSYGVTALMASIITARKVVDHEKRIAELERENKELKERLNIA